MKIYRQQTEIYDIRPEDNSTQRIVHMGENVLNLTFKTTHPLDLRVNDYVIFANEKYKLKRPVNPTRRSRHEYEYACQLMAPQYDLQDALYILDDDTGVGVLDENVRITETASLHLKQIIKCIQEVHPEWVIGDVEETDEVKNITYAEMDCMQALQHLASEFNTEYWITGTSISLGKKKYGSPFVFKYGKGEAFYELTRQNHDGRIVTALRVRGSDQNIDTIGSEGMPGYGNKYLLMPNNERYVYRNVNKYGILHGRMNFPDVYPRLIHKKPTDPGSVTSVRVDENGIYFIKDRYLNFVPKPLPDKTMVVDFQSGELNGLKIDANWHSDTEEYELIKGDYGLAKQVPDNDFEPTVGDRYLLSDIKMPPEYIRAAEKELKEKAEEAIAQLCEQKVSYKGPVNPLFFRMQGERAETGRAVVVEDANMVDNDGRVELRIQALTRNVNDDLSLDIEISDTLYVSRIDKIETAIQEHKTDTIQKINYGDAYTKRRFRDAVETQKMLEEAVEGFEAGINPIWIKTMSILAGSEDLQFRFVQNKINPIEVNPDFRMNQDTKIFTAMVTTGTMLQHMTLGIDTMSNNHLPSTDKPYKFWEMNNYISFPLTEPATPYYLYTICPKSMLEKGRFELLEKSEKVDPGNGNYYFLVGTLGTEIDGERSFTTLYGFTEILPGRITTKKIVSSDGQTYFDLSQGIIGGNIKIMSGSTGYNNLHDKPNLGQYITTSVFQSQFQVLSNEISSKVSQTNFNALGTRVSSAESSIVQQADQISSKVSNTNYNGNTISSLINQTATTITISASKIDLKGKITISMFSDNDKATINGKANKNDLKSLAFQDAVDAAQLGSTIVSGGFLNTDLIKVKRIDAEMGFIGGFQISNNNLIWEQKDYFGSGSRTLKMGLAENDKNGAIDVTFNAATNGAFGIKTVGRASGGAAIYASSNYTGSENYPNANQTFAGYFDGAICASSYYAINNSTYYKGIDFDKNVDLDKHRFTVRNGLIVELHKE